MFMNKLQKKYILWIFIFIAAFVWSTLYWEGNRIIPGAKWLSEVMPLWLVILGAVIGLVTSIFLIHAKDLFTKDIIISATGILFSLIVLRISYQRFPIISYITVLAVILVNWSLMKIRLKMKKKSGG